MAHSDSCLMFHRFGFFPRQTSKPASITPNIHMRLNKVIKELNVSIQRVADALKDNGFEGEITLNTKITEEQYTSLKKNFADDINRKEEAEKRFHSRREEKRSSKEADAAHTVGDGEEATAQATPKAEQAPQAAETAPEAAAADNDNAEGGLKVVGHIDLDAFKKPAKKTKEKAAKAEKKSEPKAEKKAEPKVEKKEAAPAPEAPKAEAPAAEEKAPAAPAAETEDKAAHLGKADSDGVFKLNSEPRLTGPKVLGTVDLSAINGSTRPKKKTKEERKKERDGKKRNRIGNERVDVNAEAKKNNAGQGGHNGRGGKTMVILVKTNKTATNNKVVARVVRRARRATMLLPHHLATKMWLSR